MQRFISLILTGLILTIGLALVTAPVASAACTGSGIRDGIDCAPESQKSQTVQGGVKTTVNTLLFIVGIASVIVIIIGGLRYILSGGNSASINSAKDTILYAVIGIVVALLGYAIVNFTLGQFGG